MNVIESLTIDLTDIDLSSSQLRPGPIAGLRAPNPWLATQHALSAQPLASARVAWRFLREEKTFLAPHDAAPESHRRARSNHPQLPQIRAWRFGSKKSKAEFSARWLCSPRDLQWTNGTRPRFPESQSVRTLEKQAFSLVAGHGISYDELVPGVSPICLTRLPSLRTKHEASIRPKVPQTSGCRMSQ